MKSIVILVLYSLLMATVFVLCGCATSGNVPSISTLPTSGLESTMKAVAGTSWFGTFCLLSFFGGVVAIGLDQRKIGSAIVIASISTVCLGLAIHRFPTWLAIVGFASSIVAVGYSILIKKKALTEIITGVQRFRENSNLADLDGTLDLNQSESTKQIVKHVKEKITDVSS